MAWRALGSTPQKCGPPQRTTRKGDGALLGSVLPVREGLHLTDQPGTDGLPDLHAQPAHQRCVIGKAVTVVAGCAFCD